MLTRRFWMEVKREGQIQMHKLFLEMLEASLGSGAIAFGNGLGIGGSTSSTSGVVSSVGGGVVGGSVGGSAVGLASFVPGCELTHHSQEMMQ